MSLNSLLLTDFYKATHLLQYPESITHLTSYLTPRWSRLSGINEVVVFGVANFVNKYLFRDFHLNFFGKRFSVIESEFKDVLINSLGYSDDLVDKTLVKVNGLHRLGYLPIEVNGLPEGTLCPMGIPILEIRTTHPEFFWVGQVIESVLSCSIWHPMISATIAHEYRKIANWAYGITGCKNPETAMSDFSMRGQESLESAIGSSAAWLTSFTNSSTIPAKTYIEENYDESFGGKNFIKGKVSTEHSVMCSDFAIYGSEEETIRRLVTKVYPETSFTMVLDSNDYWHVIENIVPKLREEIVKHKGAIGFRDDSAEDPVESLCGIRMIPFYENFSPSSLNAIYWRDTTNDNKKRPICYFNGIDSYIVSVDENMDIQIEKRERTAKEKGTVECLWEIFKASSKSSRNGSGFKVLENVAAVYGDSITIPRAKKIYERLMEKGFAANCVNLGVGSFSFQCLEEDGKLQPFTRDTFSIAIKATYGRKKNETGGEDGFNIYKNSPNKKSQKGLCLVCNNNSYPLLPSRMVVIEECSEEMKRRSEPVDLYRSYFRNGKVFKDSFENIRSVLSEERKEESWGE